MPRPKKNGEKERSEVLLEEIRSQVAQLADGQSQLRGEMQQEFQRLRTEMDGRFAIVEQAIKTHSQDIRQLQAAVGELGRDVRSLTERFDLHQKAHAT